jgi:hypothetical protein
METCDRGVIEAREAQLNATDPRTLSRAELIREVLRLRKYLGWMIVLNDDTARLCDSCTAALNLVWDAENQKDTCGTAAS